MYEKEPSEQDRSIEAIIRGAETVLLRRSLLSCSISSLAGVTALLAAVITRYKYPFSWKPLTAGDANGHPSAYALTRQGVLPTFGVSFVSALCRGTSP